MFEFPLATTAAVAAAATDAAGFSSVGNREAAVAVAGTR
jgi:hypothetical protein